MIIVKDLPKIQCIYKIVNDIDRTKFYIGSTKDLHSRIRDHLNLINRKQHKNKKLENSFYKYGKDNFSIHVLQICKNINKEKLLEIEQYWLDLLKPYYNLSSKATCVVCSPENAKARADKIRRRSRSNNKLQIANLHFDKHHNSYRIKIQYNNTYMDLGHFKLLDKAKEKLDYLNQFTTEEIYEQYIMNKEQKIKLKEEKLQIKLEKQKQIKTRDAFRNFRKKCTSIKNILYWKRQEEKRTSIYNYVSFSKNRNKFVCQFTHLNQLHYLGYFITDKEAAIAYNKYVMDNNLNRPLIVIENE